MNVNEQLVMNKSHTFSANKTIGLAIKKCFPYLYLLPAFFFLFCFSYLPFFKTIYRSFTITNASGVVKKFVWFDNFIMIFQRKEFLEILGTTFKFAPLLLIPSMSIGLILALLASKKVTRFNSVYEVLFSLPMAVASASASVVWFMIFNPSIGSLNYLLGTNIHWLSDPKWALLSVAFVTIWLQFGINFIFLLAGIRGVPEELYESAEIDGANKVHVFFKITLPMISPTLFFVLFYNITSSFQTFSQIKLLTKGGPGISTKVLVYDIFEEAFTNHRFGSASAESLVLFLIMLTITLIQFRFEKKGVHYN